MTRTAATVTEFNLTTSEVLVYTAPSIHLETAVSFVNNGAETIEIRFPGQTVLFPLAAGKAIRANAAGKVYARASATTSVLVVGFGIEPISFGSTAAGAMTPAEVAILAVSRTKRELLAELLVEAKIANQQLAKLTDEQVTAADMDRDTVVLQS